MRPIHAGDVTADDIAGAVPILKNVLYGAREARARLESYGVTAVPVNFYSNTPSIEEIQQSFEYTGGSPPYLSLFDAAVVQRTIEELMPHAGETTFANNTQFGDTDAAVYYAFIRSRRPRTIVEIGGGYSSLVALDALAKNGGGGLHVIDPFPQDFLRRPEIHVHKKRAQDIDAAFVNDVLRDGDILFIDSTHTVKTGSDCLHIYLRLLPAIRRDILVHVHDVFLPFGMPQEWLLDQQIFWTEQYLVMAFLLDNARASVLFGSSYAKYAHRELLNQMMNGKAAGGGSLWFRYDGTKPPAR